MISQYLSEATAAIASAARTVFGVKSSGEDFWLEYLRDVEPVLDIPMDKGDVKKAASYLSKETGEG